MSSSSSSPQRLFSSVRQAVDSGSRRLNFSGSGNNKNTDSSSSGPDSAQNVTTTTTTSSSSSSSSSSSLASVASAPRRLFNAVGASAPVSLVAAAVSPSLSPLSPTATATATATMSSQSSSTFVSTSSSSSSAPTHPCSAVSKAESESEAPGSRDLTAHYRPVRQALTQALRSREELLLNRLQLLALTLAAEMANGSTSSGKTGLSRGKAAKRRAIQPVAPDAELAAALQCVACARAFGSQRDRAVCPLCSSAVHGREPCMAKVPLRKQQQQHQQQQQDDEGVSVCLVCARALDVARRHERIHRIVRDAQSDNVSASYRLLVQQRTTLEEDIERLEGLLAEIGGQHTNLNDLDIKTAKEIAQDIDNGFRDYNTLLKRVTELSRFGSEDATPREKQLAKMIKMSFNTSLQDFLPRYRVMVKELSAVAESPMVSVKLPEKEVHADAQHARGHSMDDENTSAPSITALNPALSLIQGGMPVTLSVKNVDDGVRIRVGCVDLTPEAVQRQSESEILIITPPLPLGMQPIRLTNHDGTTFFLRYALMYVDDPALVGLDGDGRNSQEKKLSDVKQKRPAAAVAAVPPSMPFAGSTRAQIPPTTNEGTDEWPTTSSKRVWGQRH